MSLGYSVSRVSDRNPEARKAARQLAPDLSFGDPSEVAADPSLDLVVVATTTPSHCDLGTLAVSSGRPFVMIEKPLGRSLRECDILVEQCRSSRSRVAINHPYRFIPQYQSLMELVCSADFGGLSSMHVVGGSGGVAMLGTHLLDLFAILGGGRIAEVDGRFPFALDPNPRGNQYEDVTGCIRCWSDSGTRLVIDLSHDQGTGMLVTVAGPFGLCTFDMLSGLLSYRIRSLGERDLPASKYMLGDCGVKNGASPIDIVEGTKAHLTSLVSGASVCTPVEARSYVEVVVAAIQSDRDRRVLRINDNMIDRDEEFVWP